MALIDQLKSILSIEIDDYFENSYLVDTLNKAKTDLKSYGINVEKRTNKALRLLDELRTTDTLTLSNHTVGNGYYKASVSPPADLDQYLYVDISDIDLKELDDTYELIQGNAIPSDKEGYFIFFGNNVDFYTQYPYTSAVIGYIQDHSVILEADSDLDDMPSFAEREVLYHSAYMISLTDPTLDPSFFEKKWKEYRGQIY